MTRTEQVWSADRKAERAIAQLAMLIRRTASDSPLAGANHDSFESKERAHPRLGIVGFGKAGMQVAKRAYFGFGMDIVVYDRRAIPEDELEACGARQVATLDELLYASDIVSLHCPGTPENRHLIDALRLNSMKPGAYLINTSHGELVEMQALNHALWFETIAGAGIDLTDEEAASVDTMEHGARMQRHAA